MQSLLSMYVQALLKNIETGFAESTPLVSAFAIFNPMVVPDSDLAMYGDEELKVIINHFFNDKDKEERMSAEWGKMKYDL